MKTLNLIGLTLAVVLVVSWLAVVFYPSIQDFMADNPGWNGLRDFNVKYDAEVSSDVIGVKPNAVDGSVLVSIPYLPFAKQDVAAVREFVQGGGTLLLMDDFGYGNEVLDGLGLDLKFDGDVLLDPYLCYHNQFFPLVTDLTTRPGEGEQRQLVLDHATALDVAGTGYTVLAESSPSSFLDRNDDGLYDKGEPKGPFPVAVEATVGLGKVIVVSDPSILINSMAGRGSNGLFIQGIVSRAGDHAHVIVDESHLTKAPLDQSKYVWRTVRDRMGAPYAQVILIGAILTAVWMPFRGKGDKVE